jgi:recombination protein RecT
MSSQPTNNTETALTKKNTLRWFLEDQDSPYMNRLRRLLGDRMPHFGASLLNLAHSQKAFELVRPSSIITAGIIAATLDLPVDRNLGYAWIIPYGELAQFQIGYKGMCSSRCARAVMPA